MIVLTIDQRGSRRDRDRVPELLARLATAHTVLAFERTVGDEVQGLLDDPDVAVAIALDVLRIGHWSVGIGVGPVRMPLPGSPREGAGDAFVYAREAVEAAKSRQRAQPVAVRGSVPLTAADAEGVLLLLASVRARRSTQGWAAVDAMVGASSQDGAAARLGISQQAVSKRLAAAGWSEENAVRPAIGRLLGSAGAGA